MKKTLIEGQIIEAIEEVVFRLYDFVEYYQKNEEVICPFCKETECCLSCRGGGIESINAVLGLKGVYQLDNSRRTQIKIASSDVGDYFNNLNKAAEREGVE